MTLKKGFERHEGKSRMIPAGEPGSRLPIPDWWPPRLNYGKCILEELRSFILHRTGIPADQYRRSMDRSEDDVQEQWERNDLVRYLRALDKSKTFTRFMDLPKELRLTVFENLLTLNLDNKKIFPEVLRVSSAIHEEAEEILYTANKFIVNIGWPKFVNICVSLSRWYSAYADDHVRGFVDWPKTSWMRHCLHWLRQARKLEFHLDDNAASQMDTLALAYVVTSAATSKTVQLTIALSHKFAGTSNDDLASILWPLSLLRSAVRLNIQGRDQTLVAGLEAQRQIQQPNPDRATLETAYKAILLGTTQLERCAENIQKGKPLRAALKALLTMMGSVNGVRFNSLKSATTRVQQRTQELERNL